MAQIVIKRLRKEFGAFTAVQRSSVTIEDGEFFMLLGPSGCGKTTTLRMIAGLELPTAGEIFIYGAEASQMPPSQCDIVFVFQSFALYPNMNVRKMSLAPWSAKALSATKCALRSTKSLEFSALPHCWKSPSVVSLAATASASPLVVPSSATLPAS